MMTLRGVFSRCTTYNAGDEVVKLNIIYTNRDEFMGLFSSGSSQHGIEFLKNKALCRELGNSSLRSLLWRVGITPVVMTTDIMGRTVTGRRCSQLGC